LERIWQAHQRTGAAATLLLHPNNHPLDSDLVEVDASSRIVAFHNRPHPADRYFQNLVNAGLYVLEKRALAPFRNHSGLLDFGKDVFPAMVKAGQCLAAYNSPEYIKDIGTPERYDRVCAEYDSGVVQRSSLDIPQRAVFLDRDGTLIFDKDCLRKAEELEMIPGAPDAVRELNHQGWRAVVVTNQPVIAKGWCMEDELRRIHNKMETLLGKEHAFLDRIYFCPHHPDAGFPGERPELKINCHCRKPAPGMIEQATAELNIDLKQSWLIGDTTTDVQTARNAGLRSILVRTGSAGKDGKYPSEPDFAFNTLNEAVHFAINHST
jgi:histidinol-phosphate phosphatase family protein